MALYEKEKNMALYEVETTSATTTVATSAELLENIQYLIDEVGRVTKVFKKYGYKIKDSNEIIHVTKLVEAEGMRLISEDSSITEEDWVSALFDFFSTSTMITDAQHEILAELTEEDFTTFAQEIIYANPLPRDKKRTFAEFVTLNTTVEEQISVSKKDRDIRTSERQKTKERQKTERIIEEATPKVKTPRKRRTTRRTTKKTKEG